VLQWRIFIGACLVSYFWSRFVYQERDALLASWLACQSRRLICKVDFLTTYLQCDLTQKSEHIYQRLRVYIWYSWKAKLLLSQALQSITIIEMPVAKKTGSRFYRWYTKWPHMYVTITPSCTYNVLFIGNPFIPAPESARWRSGQCGLVILYIERPLE
jgi:hypothetical protein